MRGDVNEYPRIEYPDDEVVGPVQAMLVAAINSAADQLGFAYEMVDEYDPLALAWAVLEDRPEVSA